MTLSWETAILQCGERGSRLSIKLLRLLMRFTGQFPCTLRRRQATSIPSITRSALAGVPAGRAKWGRLASATIKAKRGSCPMPRRADKSPNPGKINAEHLQDRHVVVWLRRSAGITLTAMLPCDFERSSSGCFNDLQERASGVGRRAMNHR